MDKLDPPNPYLPAQQPPAQANGFTTNLNGAPGNGPPPGVYPYPASRPGFTRPASWRRRLMIMAFCLFSFIGGVFSTIFLQNNSLAGTPLEIVQRPVLELSNIPADAHKEWLSLQQSFKLVDRYFYEQEKINHKTMIYHAAEAALASLGDRFTAFNRPVVAKANNDFMTGRFVGVGITPEIKEGRYTVRRVIPNSPAEKAGIKEADVLYAIDGEPIPVNLSDAGPISEKLRGVAGSKVKLTFERPSEGNRRTEYEMTRIELIAPSVDARLVENNIVYIEMTRVFGENTIEEFDQKVGALAKNNPAGYVLDLRGNGGGSVFTTKQLLGRFLDGGVAYYEDAPAIDVHMRPVNVITSNELKIYDKPLVVLVDGGSASASEITAAAIRDRGRGVVIGEKTYGKGSAQRIFELPDKSAARITFEHWFTPNKVNLYDSKGIKPDIEIIPTEAQKKLNQDPQLERALKFIANGERLAN